MLEQIFTMNLMVNKLKQAKFLKAEVARVGHDYATSYFLKEMPKRPV